MGAIKLVRPAKLESTLKVVYRSWALVDFRVGDYYPFGMAQEGSWQNDPDNPDPLGIPVPSDKNDNYKFNGLETEDDLTGWVFHKFRAYDPSIGRFMSADPIADKFAHVSPYNFAENKPINSIDLWGLQAYTIYGTESSQSTFDKLSDDQIKKITGNESVNRNFTWPEGTNGYANNEADRAKAAESLADYVIGTDKDNEDITLFAHSHGGNVAIQAVDLIRERLGVNTTKKINLVTIATPAYNGEKDSENPANTSVDNHTQYYSANDKVQTTLANLVGTKKASRRYTSSGTVNVRVKDTKTVKRYFGNKSVPKYGGISSHKIHERPELLIPNK